MIVEFRLNAGDIIAATTAVGGAMQLAYGFLIRYVARPALLAGGASLAARGLSQPVGQLLAAMSVALVGASPQHPSATPCCPIPSAGTAAFSESPVLQAYLADRAAGPMRDVAFAVYFTFAFGIGAFWAFIIGNVVEAYGYPVAFGVMAASYLAAAGLLAAIRPREPATAAA